MRTQINLSIFHIIYFAKKNTVKTKTESLFRFGGVLGGPLQLLAGVDVVLLGELQVPQELGVHLKNKIARN